MAEKTRNTESSLNSAPNSAVEVLSPPAVTSPVIFASPHSGRDYPSDLLRNSRLDRHALRQSEDSYVDLLFDEAPRYGAPLLRALFPRAYVDVNRSRDELDPRMFADDLPRLHQLEQSYLRLWKLYVFTSESDREVRRRLQGMCLEALPDGCANALSL